MLLSPASCAIVTLLVCRVRLRKLLVSYSSAHTECSSTYSDENKTDREPTLLQSQNRYTGYLSVTEFILKDHCLLNYWMALLWLIWPTWLNTRVSSISKIFWFKSLDYAPNLWNSLLSCFISSYPPVLILFYFCFLLECFYLTAVFIFYPFICFI